MDEIWENIASFLLSHRVPHENELSFSWGTMREQKGSPDFKG